MPDRQNTHRQRTCCRWVIGVIHVTVSIAACACIVGVMGLRNNSTACLPTVTGNSGHESDQILTTFCELVLYSCGAVAVWHFLSLLVNCCWENKCCFFLQTLVLLVTSVLGLVGASSLTTQFLMWCSSLQTVFPNATNCLTAARYYDHNFEWKNSANMSLYYTSSIIQQGCTWGVSLLSVLLCVLYATLMCVPTVDTDVARVRVVYNTISDEEQRPLLPTDRGNTQENTT